MSAFAAFLDGEAVFSQRTIDQLAEDLADGLTPILCQFKQRGRPIRGQEQPNFYELCGRSSRPDHRLRALCQGDHEARSFCDIEDRVPE
jgi:hypothetical protein